MVDKLSKQMSEQERADCEAQRKEYDSYETSMYMISDLAAIWIKEAIEKNIDPLIYADQLLISKYDPEALIEWKDVLHLDLVKKDDFDKFKDYGIHKKIKWKLVKRDILDAYRHIHG